MNFWILSTVTLPMWASIKLLRVLRCPKHRSFSHRKFPSGGNTWKTMKIWVFIIMLKVVWLPWKHTWGLTGGTEIFWMENYQKEKSWRRNFKTPSLFEDILWCWQGGTMCPLAWIRLNIRQETHLVSDISPQLLGSLFGCSFLWRPVWSMTSSSHPGPWTKW